MQPLYRAKTITIKLDNFKHVAEIQQYHASIRHDNLFNTRSNMFRKLAQSVLHQASKALRRRRHCLIADAMISWSNFFPFPKKFGLQFIDVRESSSVHFLLQNTPNTIVNRI